MILLQTRTRNFLYRTLDLPEEIGMLFQGNIGANKSVPFRETPYVGPGGFFGIRIPPYDFQTGNRQKQANWHVGSFGPACCLP